MGEIINQIKEQRNLLEAVGYLGRRRIAIVKNARINLDAQIKYRNEQLRLYTENWTSLLEHEMLARDLTWCTMCDQVTPTAEANPITIKEVRKVSCGYEHGDWCWEPRNTIQRACDACYTVARLRVEANGRFSRYGEMMPDWYKLPAMTTKAETALATACNMPPKLSLKGDELVEVTYKKPAEVAGPEAQLSL